MTVCFIITSFYRHFPLEKENVAGYHGNAPTEVWLLSNITIEIMLAYNPLNLDSIFTVTKISTNVFQLWQSLLPHPLVTVETTNTWCIVLTIINCKPRKQCWLPMDVFPWQLLFSSMPYMQKNIFLRKGFWSKYNFLTNIRTSATLNFANLMTSPMMSLETHAMPWIIMTLPIIKKFTCTFVYERIKM